MTRCKDNIRKKIRLNSEVLLKYLKSRGISQPRLAGELDIDYSYLFRLIKGERNMGLKVFLNFQEYCERKGLDYKEFIIDLEAI